MADYDYYEAEARAFENEFIANLKAEGRKI